MWNNHEKVCETVMKEILLCETVFAKKRLCVKFIKKMLLCDTIFTKYLTVWNKH